MNIAEHLLNALKQQGLTTIFGNPGTTEIPLVAACEHAEGMRYVVALSEIAAVPMADGYARASGRPGVVNLHVAPGLGNGMGALYTAGIAGTPLLVLIGGQDRRFLHTGPILWGPVDRMAATVCKSVHTLKTRASAAATIGRAVQSLATPPYQPVALICPPDLLAEPARPAAVPLSPPQPTPLPARQARRYAEWLAAARRPAIVVTEEVYWSGAGPEVETLAEAVDALVHAAPYTGVLAVSSRSRRYAGYLPPSFAQIAERLSPYDAVLVLGGRGFRTTLYSQARIGADLAWIGMQPRVPAFDAPVVLAAHADVRAAVRAIGAALPKRRMRREAQSGRPASRVPASSALHPTRAVQRLLRHFSRSLWIDESGLSTSDVRALMKLGAGDYFINGSGGIGWGVPAAVGAALARRERSVVAIVGDGSALYASEAMWTAAHHGLALTLVVISNRRYATLNEATSRVDAQRQGLAAFTLEPPVLDFAGLSRLYGWRHEVAATERELDAALERIGRAPTSNTVIELKLDPALKPLGAARHF